MYYTWSCIYVQCIECNLCLMCIYLCIYMLSLAAAYIHDSEYQKTANYTDILCDRICREDVRHRK